MKGSVWAQSACNGAVKGSEWAQRPHGGLSGPKSQITTGAPKGGPKEPRERSEWARKPYQGTRMAREGVCAGPKCLQWDPKGP